MMGQKDLKSMKKVSQIMEKIDTKFLKSVK